MIVAKARGLRGRACGGGSGRCGGLLDSVAGAVEGRRVRKFHERRGRVMQWSQFKKYPCRIFNRDLPHWRRNTLVRVHQVFFVGDAIEL